MLQVRPTAPYFRAKWRFNLKQNQRAVRILRNTDRALLIVPATTSAQMADAEQSTHKRAASAARSPIQER